MEIKQKLTPAMQQYVEVKNRYPDCIVMFRMGDFYEMFFEDAKIASRELEITLTKRGKSETAVPLAGLPYHSLDQYVAKFIRKGFKVVIVEQMEDPKKAKGVVKRDVVRVITPGTILEDNLLDNKSNNYLASFIPIKDFFAISFADLSTGEFVTTTVPHYDSLLDELEKFKPKEIIIPVSFDDDEQLSHLKSLGYFVNHYDDRFFWQQSALHVVLTHFNVKDMACFGITNDHISVLSSGALLSYLRDTQLRKIENINSLRYYNTSDFMLIDRNTIRNLEVLSNISDGSKKGTLLDILDHTKTPMGGRLLKKWLVQPLIDKDKISSRHKDVSLLHKDILLREESRELLNKIYDIERLISRAEYKTINPRDLLALHSSLVAVKELKFVIEQSEFDNLTEESVFKRIKSLVIDPELLEAIEKTISDEPPIVVSNGGVIRSGFNKSLDELRYISSNGKGWITELEREEREKTGIKSLKIKYNKIFGYFIEVTKVNAHLVPENYVRRQTQVNHERYITEELKEKENMILNAEDKIKALELEIFENLIQFVASKLLPIQNVSLVIGKYDVLCSFAHVSYNQNYIKPQMTTDYGYVLKDSRHPVVETFEKNYTSNDIDLEKGNHIFIITGPNMSGKSTFMRQVSLISLMAQIGCFVPASEAKLSVVDKIFTRIGASDNIFAGKSTFSVEMGETANILNNATDRSLVILDEIGRGTSTYDGISIAWAVVEYLHDVIGCKTLFATHYHQLNLLEKKYSGIVNYNIKVKELDDNILFLHKIEKGGTDKSYGIHVARISGVPSKVIDRSKVIMNQFEMNDEVGERLHKSLKRGDTIYNSSNNSSSDEEIIDESSNEELIVQKTLLNM